MESIYLDNAATTYPKPEEVMKAVERFMREVGGSAGRSGHKRAVETGRMVFEARSALAEIFGVREPLRIAFTKNATEALNIVIRGMLKDGDHVITTSMEHNSVMRPLKAVRKRGVDYSIVRCDPYGILDPGMVEKEVRTRTKMIIATGASNVTGTLMPLGDLAEIARKHRLILAVDAAQTAGRFPIDVELEGIDVLVFTGHKELFGLQGTGGIYIREGIDFEPIMTGGTGSISSSIEQPRQMPDVLESGTLNAHGIAGLLAGASFVRGVGIDKIREHEMELAQDLIEELLRIPKMKIYGPLSTQNRVGIISFNLEGISSSELARVLDEKYQIALRSGLHCSPMAHKTIGTMERGTVRAGLSYLNTHEHISRLIEALIEISKRLTYS